EMLRTEHFDTTAAGNTNCSLNWKAIAGDRESIATVVFLKQPQATTKILAPQEGRRGINAACLLHAHALSIQLLDRMANDRDGAGVVICQLGRSHERDSRTQFTRHASDFVVVGRNDDLVEASTLQSHLDRPGNHRLAAEHFNVLAGNALASTSCRNN